MPKYITTNDNITHELPDNATDEDIKKWEEKTGVPILLNTSFNDREPIVETPEDAVNCFMGTNIDYLYFFDENILVSKRGK